MMKAMVFASAKDDQIEGLILDDQIGFQRKYDGSRGIGKINLTDGVSSVEFLARGGGPLKHTAAMQWFGAIERELLRLTSHCAAGVIYLDGEIMIDSGRFVVFDVIEHERTRDGEYLVNAGEPYLMRYAYLRELLGNADALVMVAPLVRGAEDKREFYDYLLKQGAEGVMAKDIRQPYEEGKRVRHSVKVKFEKTADCIVTSYSLGRNEAGNLAGNIGLALCCPDCTTGMVMSFDGPTDCPTCEATGQVDFGSVSAIGRPECEPGEVIEVKYLYRQANGLMVQPRMLQKRPDKSPADCTFEQFVDYEKAVD